MLPARALMPAIMAEFWRSLEKLCKETWFPANLILGWLSNDQVIFLVISPHASWGCVLLYKGRSINKFQNNVILATFKIWKIQNTHFVGNLIGTYLNFYMRMTSLLWRCLYLERSKSTQYFVISHNSRSVKQHCRFQHTNVFNKQTCLYIRHKCFNFEHVVRIHYILHEA